MNMSGLFTFGVACIAAAIIGGGLKWSGIEIPVIGSTQRQIALGILGIVIVAYSAHQLHAERAARDQSVTFSISDRADFGELLEEKTSVYLLGKKVAELHMTKDRPHATATVTVPRPGTYAYRIERMTRGVYPQYRDRELKEFMGTSMLTQHHTGEGLIEVSPGVAYTLFGFYKHGDTNLKMRLLPVGAKIVDHMK